MKEKILYICKWFLRLFHRITTLISVLILALCISICGLYVYGIRMYVVQTGSMEPTIETGSLCLVNQRISFEDIKENDIIAFKVGSMLVTHRAVKVNGVEIVTKGDANNASDAAPVVQENYIGKTIYHVPKIGYVLTALKSRRWRIIGITAAIVIVLSGFLNFEKTKETHEKQEKQESDKEE